MEWLEDFLSRFKGAVLLISHDRAFIDRTATAVAELAGGHLIVSGPATTAISRKSRLPGSWRWPRKSASWPASWSGSGM